jgi:diacylglycerol kinase (ATP)
VNPAAGDGRTECLWPALRERLARLAFPFDVAETRGPGHAMRLAAEAARARVPLVVAVGGDGTLNEVVNGLASPSEEAGPVTVGALMTGRGRDACRNLGLARDPARAARRLVEGRAVPRDLGLAVWPGGRRLFLGCAGVGFDAEVARRAGGRGGRLTYLRAVLDNLREYDPAPMAVTAPDGDPWTGPAASVVVCNGAYFGGGMRIAPGARADDGLLDLVRLGDLGRLELALWLPTVYWGGHLANPKIRTRRTATVQVTAESPLPVQIDGEIGACTPLAVTVRPGALRLVV